MPLRSVSLRLPLLAGCLLAIAPIARAQSGVSVNVSSSASVIYAFPAGLGMATDSHSDQMSAPVYAMKTVGSSVSSNTIYAISTSQSTASAQIGQANVSLSAHELQSGSADSNAVSQWFDTLRVTSATLPPGTPAQITLTAHYTGSFAGTVLGTGVQGSTYSGFMTADLESNASIVGGSGIDLNYSGASHLPAQAADTALPMDVTLTQTLNAQVGQTLIFTSSAQLTDNATGSFKFNVEESGSLTATFGATPVNSAVTLTQIAAVTPEPGAALIMGSGLLAGFCLLRRRKS